MRGEGSPVAEQVRVREEPSVTVVLGGMGLMEGGTGGRERVKII